jgi:hypothetical protein
MTGIAFLIPIALGLGLLGLAPFSGRCAAVSLTILMALRCAS